jgi:proline iminopeptidase
MPSEPSEKSFELGTILVDVEYARNELGLGDVVVVGHSGHALMALEYAKKYPDHASHVVMIGCSPTLDSPEMVAERNRYWEESVDPVRKKVFEENLARTPDKAIESLPFSKGFIKAMIRNGPGLWFDPRYDSTWIWEGAEPNEIVQKIWSKDLASIDIAVGLENFAKPVLLALGRYDFSGGPPSTWDALRAKFHDLTVRVFERSAHTPQLEEAELFDSELIDWLQSRS